MSQGYHSRSPEEFKEYLENLNKKKKKKNLSQFIILADIVILLLIFYIMVNQFNKAGGKVDFIRSKKVQVKNATFYLTRGEENKNSVNYFLFVTSQENQSFTFPDSNLIDFKIIAPGNIICAEKQITLPSKNIKNATTEFFLIEIPKTILSGSPAVCQNIFELEGRGIETFVRFFSKSAEGIKVAVNFSYADTTVELLLVKDLWSK